MPVSMKSDWMARTWTHGAMLFNAALFRIQRSPGRVDIGKRRMIRARAMFYESLWRSAAAATGASVAVSSNNVIEIRRGEIALRVRENVTEVDDAASVARAADKLISHQLMSQGGIPVPRHILVKLGDYERALAYLRSIGGPLVVKPAASTGGGEGVTTNVFT